MIILVIGFLILSNVFLFTMLIYERKYSKFADGLLKDAMHGWQKDSKWWSDLCGELSEELIRLRGLQ